MLMETATEVCTAVETAVSGYLRKTLVGPVSPTHQPEGCAYNNTAQPISPASELLQR